MYLYFDKKGVLLEIVNDEALRQYNHQVNTMYVYIENVPTTELPKGLLKLQYWFERPNGETTAVYDTLSHPGDVVVTETVPFDIKRDVRKFSYGTRYKMFKIEMPSGRIIGQDESGNPVYEYNIFEDDGPVSLTIKAIFVEGAKELTLGKVVFTIEKEVVIPTNSVSVSQYEYILRAIDALTFTVGKVTTETLNPTSEASVTVTQDKSSTELKNYPVDFEFGIPKGTTFTPAVAENGDISWTNDGGLENPKTVNIKGATGATPNIVANATVDENVGVPEVNVTKTGTNENPTLTFNFRNLRGKDAEIPSELTDHLTDYSNPHKTTAEQVSIDDIAGKYTATNVEGALSEIATSISNLESGLASAGKVDDVQGVNGDSIVVDKIAKLSKSAVGLGNVDNTADKDKRVAYADEAGKVTNKLSVSAHNSATSNKTVAFDGGAAQVVDFGVDDFAFSEIDNGIKISIVDKGYATKTYVDAQNNKKFNKAGGTITGDLAVNGGVTIGGNLTVNGTTTTVDSTTLQVKDKLIEVAHGNTEKLTSPAGIVAPKYDGTNSCALVFNGDGIASVGDIVLDASGNIDVTQSNLQSLATRTGLVNDNLIKYDSTNQTLVDTGKKISDFATAAQGETADAAKLKADANATEISNIKDGTTVVKKAEHANAADNAANVTTNINGKAISSIFETDGTTVKEATHAGNATTANLANKVAKSLSFINATQSPAKESINYNGSVEQNIYFDDSDFTFSSRGTQLINLANTGVTAGQYSAVNVDAKGRVTAGGKSIEWGTAGQTEPSGDLMVGGLFMELISQ